MELGEELAVLCSLSVSLVGSVMIHRSSFGCHASYFGLVTVGSFPFSSDEVRHRVWKLYACIPS